MKKLFFSLVLALGVSAASFAQTTAPATAKTLPPPVVSKQIIPKKAAPAKTAPAVSSKVKADGTPDMRYKENKQAKTTVPAGPKKADGTPDLRYKKNKAAATAPKTKK